jgi:hypothetical protein
MAQWHISISLYLGQIHNGRGGLSMRFFMRLKEKKQSGVVLKIDFEKAYDKVT